MSEFKKIAGPMRLEGDNREYEMPPARGGSSVHQLQYMVKVLDANATTDDIDLRIEHSPNGVVWETHTAAPGAVDVGTLPAVHVFDADDEDTKILGEVFRAVIETGASGEWIVVELYEMTKTL